MADPFIKLLSALQRHTDRPSSITRREMDDLAAAALDRTRHIFVSRLRRKSLLLRRPAYLGYAHHAAWDLAALSEASHDAFVWAVLERLRGLSSYLATDPARISAIIAGNIDRFITERQRKHDPLERSVWGCIIRALLILLGEGVLAKMPADWMRSGRSVLSSPRATEQIDSQLAYDRLSARNSWERFIAALAPPPRKSAPPALVVDELRWLFDEEKVGISVSDLLRAIMPSIRLLWAMKVRDPDRPVMTDDATGEPTFVLAVFPDEISRFLGTGRRAELFERIQSSAYKAHIRERLTRVAAYFFQELDTRRAPSQAAVSEALKISPQRISEDWERLLELFSDDEPDAPVSDELTEPRDGHVELDQGASKTRGNRSRDRMSR